MKPMMISVLVLCGVSMAAAAHGEDHFFDSGGVRIRYTDQGHGDAIVLLHGNGRSLEEWNDSGVAPDLARDHRVIALDARGHGKSGKPHNATAYGRQMGLDVVRLLDHLGIRRANIVGYSMGAWIVSELLVSHPDRFVTATLGGGTGPFHWTAEDTALWEKVASETERECVSPTLVRRTAPASEPPSEETLRRLSTTCMANPNVDRFANAAVDRGFKELAATPAHVAAVKVPTVAIVGSLDENLPDLQALKKLRPNLKLVVIDGATHTGERGAMRRPEFAAAIREFIASENKRGVR
jgi:pimeloyl-ACP methyl ester carboxylesterase